jgi:hypothetical protein
MALLRLSKNTFFFLQSTVQMYTLKNLYNGFGGQRARGRDPPPHHFGFINAFEFESMNA